MPLSSRAWAVALLAAAATLGCESNYDDPRNQPGIVPQPCDLAGDSPDREPIETRCDGIDNDCDGLVDVLMPVAANACAGTGASCSQGFAACDGGARVCMAPGPAPEVADGADNDCNGAVDDVAPVDVSPRMRLLVPPYLYDDGPEEIDTIASIAEQWGIPIDRPEPRVDLASQLADLSRYALVVVPSYLLSSQIDANARAALEAFATRGGVVVLTKVVDDGEGEALALAGISSSTRRTDVEEIAFEAGPAVAARVFDSPEERRIPLSDDPVNNPVEGYVMTPSDPGTTVVAHAVISSASVGALVTRRAVGAGAVYALGHNLHAFGHYRCYINCFEPSGDMIGLFMREALREGARGHVVLKHTVPGPEDSVMLLTHDVDAPDAHNKGAWGAPGALQVADVEVAHHTRGTYLVTTDYVIGYYNEDMVRALCDKGMCPIGAHSVRHADNFLKQPRGTCEETYATYTPDRGTSLCGEIRVSKEILQGVTGSPVLSWRSPYLYVHPSLYDVLEAEGFVADSSYAVGDLKFNLPISLARTGLNQDEFHHRALYTFPIAVEDGIGGVENGVETREEMQQKNFAKFVTMWSYALLRNADNFAFTTALLHPSYGRGVGQDNLRYKLAVEDAFLKATNERGIKSDLTMGDLATFWRAREGVSIDARYTAAGGYAGTLTVGAYPVTNLTLELGDAVASFTCATCGKTELHGRRVTLRDTLPAGSTHAFTAKPGLP